MKPQTQAITEAEKAARIAHLQAKEELTLAEQTELDQLTGDEVPFDPTHHTFEDGQVGGISPAEEKHLTEIAKREAKRKRTPKEAIAEKRAQRTPVFPTTVLLDTEAGTYQYLNSQAELDQHAGDVLQDPERYVIIQGERKAPNVNWK